MDKDNIYIPPQSEVIKVMNRDIEDELFNADADEYKNQNIIEVYIAWKLENGGFGDDAVEEFESKPAVHFGEGGAHKTAFKKGRHSK